VDVSIRPGWFYHPEQDKQVKTLRQLVDIYYQSVGMNFVLLLNVPPDRRGRLHEVDVERLRQFGAYISNIFKNDKLTDGNILWKAHSGASKEYNLVPGEMINTVMLQEDILKGQRVEEFKVEGFVNNEWVFLTEGTTIGYKRLLKFADTNPSKLRITVTETRDIANINKVGAFFAPALEGDMRNIHLSDISSDQWKSTGENPLIIDLGQVYPVKGFTYSPDNTKESVFNYICRVSEDAVTWKVAKKGEFSNIKNNPVPRQISLNEIVYVRYIQLEAVSGVDGGHPVIEMNQIGILTK